MSVNDRPLALIAGIGNPDRGDDGFGPAVARRLSGRTPPGVRIIERGGDTLGLIEDWSGFSSVILVDAVASITEPGRVHRLDLADSPLPIGFVPPSSHAFGVAETVELARALNRLPRHLVAYLAEGERFEIGVPLSPAIPMLSR
jgi:hydrogenase maturation protease